MHMEELLITINNMLLLHVITCSGTSCMGYRAKLDDP